ncbi:MAG: DedA family protein [Hyphomicrobiaceae bacterium]
MDFESLVHGIVTFIKEHRSWAAPIMFVLAFTESLAFISLVLPAWTALVAIGTIVGAGGGNDFWVVLAAAAVGAALGDWISYWLGYHYHEQISRMWPINRYPNLLPRGQAFFDKWGDSAIWLGRFTGPLRASVPIIAGTVRMPQLRFQIANWGSAFLWAAVLMFFGDGLGKIWQVIHHRMAG